MIPIRDTPRSTQLPIITVSLIILNLLVYLYQGYLGTQPEQLNNGIVWQDAGLSPPPSFNPQTYQLHLRAGGDPRLYPISAANVFLAQYATIPGELTAGTDLPPTIPLPLWMTLFTSLFLHGGLFHLLGNMLYLWIFGNNVEYAMGRVRFLIFYLVCGAVASLSQVAISPASPIPLIGASGAIAGVLAAYLMLFPTARVLTLIPIFFFLRLISLPAILLLGLWFLLQIISGAGALGSAGGVAWFAHIGGFLAGLVLVFLFRRRGVPVTLWTMIRNRRPGH